MLDHCLKKVWLLQTTCLFQERNENSTKLIGIFYSPKGGRRERRPGLCSAEEKDWNTRERRRGFFAASCTNSEAEEKASDRRATGREETEGERIWWWKIISFQRKTVSCAIDDVFRRKKDKNTREHFSIVTLSWNISWGLLFAINVQNEA